MANDPPLHGRHRDKNGEISRKHGNTLVRTLRKVYGAHFAQDFPETAKLSEVMDRLDESSLSALHRDHDADLLSVTIGANAD
jgi:hypothetical protein